MPRPTVVKWTKGSSTGGSGASQWKGRLVTSTKAGDTAFVFGQWGSGSNQISTIVDDQGGSLAGGDWVLDANAADAGNSQSIGLWRRSNCPAGLREIVVTFTGTQTFVQFHAGYSNMLATKNPVAGVVTGNPSGDVLPVGPLSPAVPETAVFYFTAQTGASASSAWTQFRPQNPQNYDLICPDGNIESCGMWGYESGIAAFTPTLFVQNGRKFVASATLAVAYRTVPGIGSPAPSQIADVLFHASINPNGSGGKGPFGTTISIDLPARDCNAICIGYAETTVIYSDNPSGRTTSSPSNTFASSTPVSDGSGVTVGLCWAVGTFNADTTLTFSLAAQPNTNFNGFPLQIWGLSNIKQKNDDKTGHGAINAQPPQTQNSVLTTAIATTEPNEIVCMYLNEVGQTVTNITATNGTALQLENDVGQYMSLDGDQDAGYAHIFAATPGNYNFNVSWSNYEGAVNIGGWQVSAASFQSVTPPVASHASGPLAPNARRG